MLQFPTTSFLPVSTSRAGQTLKERKNIHLWCFLTKAGTKERREHCEEIDCGWGPHILTWHCNISVCITLERLVMIMSGWWCNWFPLSEITITDIVSYSQFNEQDWGYYTPLANVGPHYCVIQIRMAPITTRLTVQVTVGVNHVLPRQ